MFGFWHQACTVCTRATTAAVKVENIVIVTELAIGGGKHRKGKQITSHLHTRCYPPPPPPHCHILLASISPHRAHNLKACCTRSHTCIHTHTHTCEYPPPTSELSFALVSIVTWYAPLAVEKEKKEKKRRTMGKREDRSWDKDWHNDNKNQPIVSLSTTSITVIDTMFVY